MTTNGNENLAIETNGLSKCFGDKAAVRDLNLRIPLGCVYGFIGPNGAGKSTTIRMLMGILRSSGGEASVLGFDPSERCEAMRQQIGYVPELHFIYRWMRVLQVIQFCRSLYATWNDRVCKDLMSLFELDERKKVKELSKGMVAKLSLIVAIAHEPELLILDEPTSGLDPLVREEFLDGVLRTICERQKTVLFSSHTLGDVQRLADRVGIIHEGTLLADCPTDELLTGTKRIRAVLRDGHRPGEPPEGTVWQRLDNREWLLTVGGYTPAVLDRLRREYPVEHVEVIDIGLEEVFKDFIRGRRVPA